MTLRERLDSAVLAGVVVAALYAAFAFLLLEYRGGDVSRFVFAGGALVEPEEVPPGLTVIPDIGGYDGIAFYRLALDPFTRVQTAHGITLDNPPYRQQRIVYPLIVWALCGGRPPSVPPLLVLVNVAAAAAVGVAGAWIARAVGLHALWGICFALYPGFLISLSRDTAEIVAVAFGLAGIAATLKRHWPAAAALFTVAVLSRETMLILPLSLAAAWVFARVRSKGPAFPWWIGAVPLATYALWQILLALNWGTAPFRAVSPDWTIPFSEYLRVVIESLPRRARYQRLYLAECAFLALVMVSAAVAMVRRHVPAEWRFALIANLALAAVLPRDVWAEDFAFMRVLADLFVTAVLVVLMSRSRSLRALTFFVSASVWLYLAQVTLDL